MIDLISKWYRDLGDSFARKLDREIVMEAINMPTSVMTNRPRPITGKELRLEEEILRLNKIIEVAALNGHGFVKTQDVVEKLALDGTKEDHGDGVEYGLGPCDFGDEGVHTPSHYLFGDAAGVECIDAIRSALSVEEFRGYCKGNSIKYIWRSNHKGSRDIDLKKCAWYSRMAAGDDPREER